MPIFFSIDPHSSEFSSPKLPSSFGIIFGTTNKLIPLIPSGALGVLAKTKCIMFSDKSCSPQVIKIFVPVIL